MKLLKSITLLLASMTAFVCTAKDGTLPVDMYGDALPLNSGEQKQLKSLIVPNQGTYHHVNPCNLNDEADSNAEGVGELTLDSETFSITKLCKRGPHQLTELSGNSVSTDNSIKLVGSISDESTDEVKFSGQMVIRTKHSSQKFNFALSGWLPNED